MDMRSLELFSHLAQSLHFAKTAEAKHVSPSTLSRVIQRLEQELGVSLLERDNRTVVLTRAGRELHDVARLQLQQWQQFKANWQNDRQQLEGRLHVFCSVTAAYSHLPAIVDRFRQQQPLVEFELTTGDAADAIALVQQGEADFAIAARPDKLANSLHFHSLGFIPLAIIAPIVDCAVTQALAAPNPDWREIPLIQPEHGPARKRMEHWFRHKQLGKPKIYAQVSGHEALVSMVALGCGVGIAPEVVIENSPVKDRIVRLTGEGAISPFDLGVCCLKRRCEDPIVSAFLRSLA